MFPYIIEELSWATMQEKEIGARKARRGGTPRRRRDSKGRLRRAVARRLVHAGLRLDPKAADAPSRQPVDKGY